MLSQPLDSRSEPFIQASATSDASLWLYRPIQVPSLLLALDKLIQPENHFQWFFKDSLGQTSSTSSSSSLPDQLPIAHHGRASVSSSSKHFLTHILKLSLEFQCNSIETRCFSTIILTYSHKVVDFLTLFQPDYKTPQVNNSVFLIKNKEGNGIMERIKKTRLERWLRVHTRCRSYKGPSCFLAPHWGLITAFHSSSQKLDTLLASADNALFCTYSHTTHKHTHNWKWNLILKEKRKEARLTSEWSMTGKKRQRTF